VNGFVYDDHSQIELNPNVHSFHNIAKIFDFAVIAARKTGGGELLPSADEP
jgi:hypothetical protein